VGLATGVVSPVLASEGWKPSGELSLEHLQTVAPKGFTEADKELGQSLGWFGTRDKTPQVRAPSKKPSPFVEYHNPILNQTLPLLNGDQTPIHPDTGQPRDVYRIPEGLILVDSQNKPTTQFDLTKPTIIHIHGWTPDGSLEPFYYPDRWDGYNRFVFNWHADAFDPGIMGMIPDEAEARVWAGYTFQKKPVSVDSGSDWKRVWGAAGEKLVSSYIHFWSVVGRSHYDQEIRVTGHSLGAQLGIYLVYALAVDPKTGLHRPTAPIPDRLDLLDPYVGSVFQRSTLPTHSPITLDPSFRDAQPREINLMTLLQHMLEYFQSRYQVAVVDYSAITGIWFSHDLWRFTNFQEMSAAWLGRSNVIYQHVALKATFFASVSEPRKPLLKEKKSDPAPTYDAHPLKAFTAATSTHDIPGYGKWIRSLQSSDDRDYRSFVNAGYTQYGIHTVTLQDDVFYLEEGTP
jgi:hypothetical protein